MQAVNFLTSHFKNYDAKVIQQRSSVQGNVATVNPSQLSHDQLSHDTFSLNFSGSLKFSGKTLETALNPSTVLKADSGEMEHSPHYQNLIAGRIYAKGDRGVQADPVTAKRFFDQAIVDEDPINALYSKMIVAKTYLDGYYTIEKDPKAAEALLKQVIQESKGTEESAYFQVEAARLLLQEQKLSKIDREAHINTIKSALRSEGGNLYLSISTARFFNTIMKDPKSAKACVLLAVQQYLDCNKQSDLESPEATSKGSLGAKEMLALAKELARGANGLPKDANLSKYILETLMATVITPNPTHQFEAARIFANDLGDKVRAEQLVDFMLYESKYPDVLGIAQFKASDLQDLSGARELLVEMEKKPLSISQRIEMAHVYAQDLNNPSKARQLLNSVDVDSIPESRKSVEAIQLAEIYNQYLDAPELARRYLDLAKDFVRYGGSGNPQETRIQLAAAYVDIVKDTPAALAMIREAIELAPAFWGSDETMASALKVLARCDESNPNVAVLSQQAKRVIQKIEQKNDITAFFGQS